jgi:hypothetical protein
MPAVERSGWLKMLMQLVQPERLDKGLLGQGLC